MRALEISLNGRNVCVAGLDKNQELSATVKSAANSGDGDLVLDIGGVISQTDQNWRREEPLWVGDEIQIRVVEVSQPDEPKEQHRSKHPAPRQIGGIIGPY
ncbi:MAG TPA: hypothetical protein VH596_14670 [Terriglobales bacterium]